MPLTADYKQVKGWRIVCLDEAGVKANPPTESCVFLAIAIGMDRITEKNWMEFWTRCHVMERLVGTMRQGPDGDVWLKPDEVKERIGLFVNVENISTRKFNNKVAKILRQRAEEFARDLEKRAA